MRRSLILALALTSDSAFAQTQTTDCYRDYWGNYSCRTQQQSGDHWRVLQTPPPDAGKSFMEGFERGQRQRAEMERQRLMALERGRQEAEIRAAEEARASTRKASEMVMAGDCAGAEAYALSIGNLVLATQVKDFCQK